MKNTSHTLGEQLMVKTACAMCPAGCGVNLHVDYGRIVKVEGMQEHPITKGFTCVKGRQIPGYVYSNDRLRYPMRKENGIWKRILWEEALDVIATKLRDGKEKYGATSLAIFSGDSVDQSLRLGHDMIWRFGDVYRSPNLFYVHGFCAGARYRANFATFGKTAVPDVVESKCIVVWAQNTHESWPDRVQNFLAAIKKGAKLIVIDPRRTSFAKRADIHVQPRPGTDGALALAIINNIILEGMYDREFVDNWTVGFDKLSEHVKQYPPEWAEQITGVEAADIRMIAQMYATIKPACIQFGCKLEQTAGGVQTIRSIATLVAITGNIDSAGGNLRGSSEVAERPYRLLEEMGDMKLTGADKHPLMHEAGGTFFGDGNMPNFSDLVLKGEPHFVRNMIIAGANPIVTWPNSTKVRQALEKVSFLVVMDVFMTPTAELADIVLPACTFLERVSLCRVYETRGAMMLRRKVIEPLWESWSDCKFWLELARRLGYEEHFPWKDDEETLDYYLEPSGLTVKYLRDEHPTGIIEGRKYYDEYKEKGFPTPSGRVELYSSTLEKLGYDPLPSYQEPGESPLSTPELAMEYPLVLTAGVRELEYWHSQYRNIRELRRRNSGPSAEIHLDTASNYGIQDGDLMIIETKRGRIEVRARVTDDIMSGIVSVGHAWPEASENVLTDDMPADPLSGYPAFAGVLCRIKKKT
ncbi:molybdopterin-dependent oxidoreductase [Chloroflexota bacterium]